MIGGVSFQPEYGDQRQQQQGSGPNASSAPQGVQEAIKILSLRLPTVVGARAVAPQALLSSPGSGGNPRVDSVVNSVMARFFPTAGGAQGASVPSPAPSLARNGPMSDPFSQPWMPQGKPRSSASPNEQFAQRMRPPRVVVDKPHSGTFADPIDGGGIPPASIAPPPPIQWPDYPMFSEPDQPPRY